VVAYEKMRKRFTTSYEVGSIGRKTKKFTLFECRIPPNRMISYKNPYKKWVDLFIIVLAIFNSVFFPIELAFRPHFAVTVGYKVFDILVDVIFVLDIVVMYFTSFQDIYGQEIYESSKVARNYMNTRRFWVDSLSILGIELFTYIDPFFKYFSLFKIARVTRIDVFIKSLSYPV
jgi:hypothetical protein